MTSQIRSKPARISSALRHACSLASMMPLIGSPVARQCASSSAPEVKGYSTGVVSGVMRSSPAAVSSTTKPPPTE